MPLEAMRNVSQSEQRNKKARAHKVPTYYIATPPYRGWQRSEGRLLLHSFLSLDMFVAFSILRFGTSAESVSWVDLTQFNRTWRTRRCSGMRRACPSQLHLLSRAFITGFFLDSSARDRREHFRCSSVKFAFHLLRHFPRFTAV